MNRQQVTGIILLKTVVYVILPQLHTVSVSEGITLTSTLKSDHIACPLEKVTFTCTTRGSNIQEWYSDAYITGIDDRIQLHQGRRSGTGRAANATIISIRIENGSKVIVSELCILVSTQYLIPTVSCGNNGLGKRKNVTFAIQAVKLNSTLECLRGEYVAYPQQRVYFTCTTTGSNIQEWYSPDYITGIDDRIQLHEGRLSGSGRAANATVNSININVLGEKVIISRLILVASTQFQLSTVSCGNNGHGMRDNITFRIQAVKLNTTLESVDDRYLAYPQQRVYFTCMTTGSNIQEWYSPEYITGVDNRIQLHEGRLRGSGRAANATIISITTNEAREKVIQSRLSLFALTEFLISTVSCGNNGHGMRDNITFNVTDAPAPRISSTLPPEGNACPGQRIDFVCVTLDSNHQTWTSSSYTGEEIHIRHTLPIGQQRNSTRFPSTSAVLVSKSEVNGRLQLTSHLTITVSESVLDQSHSVTCSSAMDSSSISFWAAAEACDASSYELDATTTRQTVASSEEITNTGIYIWAPFAAVLIAVILFLVIVLIFMKQKRKGNRLNNQASDHSTDEINSDEVHRSTIPSDERKGVPEDAFSSGEECSFMKTGTGRDGLLTNASDA